ncbi:nucleoside hydrolase [Jiangella alba]|uniref:nucleoside hydrolase n=1 Tax=Jiangella alba TaxID=561176 RepID=UPI0014958CE9|nr:nucleoside hydrolase [Jiangella alba]
MIDTDIGSDVDDIVALATILGSPEIDLLGVTTVYGDPVQRARTARYVLRLAGRPDTPVAVGAGRSLAGRPLRSMRHESPPLREADDEEVDPAASASAFLTQAVARRPGTVAVLAIGPLTNLAAALRADPGFARDVHSIHVMGGSFAPPGGEYNMLCDPEAAAEVLGSGAPVVVTGLEITQRVRVDTGGIARIAAAGPLGAIISREMTRYAGLRDRTFVHPHDAVAAAGLLAPDLVATTAVRPVVEVDGPGAGHTRAAPDPAGSVRLVDDIDAEAVTALILDRVVRAGTH